MDHPEQHDPASVPASAPLAPPTEPDVVPPPEPDAAAAPPEPARALTLEPPPEPVSQAAPTPVADTTAPELASAPPADVADAADLAREPFSEGAPEAAAPAPELPASEAAAETAAPSPEAPRPARPAPPPLSPEEQARRAAAAEERKARAQAAWDRVVAAKDANETLTGVVTAAVKGGLLVDVGGIRGFLPASQVRTEKGVSHESLVKQRLPLRVIDVEEKRRRIVVSQRKAQEAERKAARAELIRTLTPGDVREGIVVRIAEFGAFVDLGGVDGLVPMRELAFERIEKASDVVSVGERLRVEVLRIEENGKRISLSRKNALPDPWKDHGDLLKPGTTIEGTVVAKEPRLRVEIAPGVEGTVRESDANPDEYAVGEKIEVQVRFADRRTRRITLSTPYAATYRQQQTASGFAPLGVELSTRGRR